jgi:hypothetical protein
MKYKIILFLKYYLRANISLKNQKSYLKIILEMDLMTRNVGSGIDVLVAEG